MSTPDRGSSYMESSVDVRVRDALAWKRRLEPLVTALARLDQLAVGRHQRFQVLRFGRLERCQAGVRHGGPKLVPVRLLDERTVVGARAFQPYQRSGRSDLCRVLDDIL